MRALSDRKLAEPYKSWIDRAVPLPDGVRLLPRTVDVGHDALVFLMLGAMFGGMGALVAALMPPWRFDPAETGWGPPLFLGAICLALWSVPLLLLRRLIHTLGAAADQRRGALRQGVLVGAEGLLVRMEPGRGHPIAADQFVAARLFPPKDSQDRRKPTVIVETRQGTVEFFADRLAAPPEDIHRAARERWREKWKEPGPLLRRDRKKRPDLRTGRRMVLAGYLFAAAMVAVFGGLGGLLIVGGQSSAGEWFSLVVFLGLVLVAVSVVNLFYRFLALKLWYRCPECGGKTVRAFDALPDVHFYCRACNVEWATGVKELADQS
jgi:hypothetical protein